MDHYPDVKNIKYFCTVQKIPCPITEIFENIPGWNEITYEKPPPEKPGEADLYELKRLSPARISDLGIFKSLVCDSQLELS